MAGLGQHQVDRGVAAMRAAAAELVDISLLGLDARASGAALIALVQLESQVAELKHRVLAHASAVEVRETGGATSTAAWLATATRTTVRAAHRAHRLALALESYSLVRTGMATGAVNLEQAEVIARALDDLPAGLPSWVPARAEEVLVGLADTLDAKALRVCGDRILDTAAPEIGEAHEAKKLADEEADAEKAASLVMTPDGAGKVRGRFVLPEMHAAMFRKMLLAFVIQHHDPQPEPKPTGDEDEESELRPRRRATSHELGLAFCELIERLDHTAAPKAGGTGATVVVTMSLDALRGGLAAATIDTGDRINAATARRLACEAGIIPVVLDGRGEVLDQGRAQRYFTRAQRIALVVRDKGCTAVGCQTGPWFCHAHHDQPWALGGQTDLADGRLLCPTHHRMAHSDRYDLRVLTDNRVEFILRT